MTPYNCFPRILGVVINRIFGLPLVTYFDDMGSLSPSEINKISIGAVKIFHIALGVFLKKDKTGLGR